MGTQKVTEVTGNRHRRPCFSRPVLGLSALVVAFNCLTVSPGLHAEEPVDLARHFAELNLLGCLHLQGGGEERARDFFELSAADLPQARFNLGVMLLRGQGGRADVGRGRAHIESAWQAVRLPEAGAWLLESALGRRDMGTARALAKDLQGVEQPRVDLVMARLRFAEGRHEQAMTHLTRAAQAGNGTATRLLAMLHQHGTGLPRDAMESASWQMIAEALLSPVRPSDSIFHAAVKHSMQANDWTPRGPMPAEIVLACAPSGTNPPGAITAAGATAGSVLVSGAGTADMADPARASPATTAHASSAGNAESQRAGSTGAAARSNAALSGSAAAAAEVVATSATGRAAPFASATAATTAEVMGAEVKTNIAAPLPPFEVNPDGGLRDPWIAYGRAAGVSTQWIGADVAVSRLARVHPQSLPALGQLIVDSARAVGIRLKLQIQEDETGALQALRIVPVR